MEKDAFEAVGRMSLDDCLLSPAELSETKFKDISSVKITIKGYKSLKKYSIVALFINLRY